MSPRMRPSSTRKLMPSSAMFVPNALRRPRASMQAMVSALFLGSFQQILRFQTQPLHGCVDPRPFLRKKPVAFAFQQQIARAGFDEHAEAAPFLDKLLVDQFLIALQDRDRI